MLLALLFVFMLSSCGISTNDNKKNDTAKSNIDKTQTNLVILSCPVDAIHLNK